MKRKQVTVFSDGANVRLRNRRVSFTIKNNGAHIQFLNADSAYLRSNKHLKKTCAMKVIRKDRLVATYLRLTEEALAGLAIAYLAYQKKQRFKV